MRTIQDKCTPSISFETEASVGINALADSLKTPLAVYRLSEPYTENQIPLIDSIRTHLQRATTKHHRKPTEPSHYKQDQVVSR